MLYEVITVLVLVLRVVTPAHPVDEAGARRGVGRAGGRVDRPARVALLREEGVGEIVRVDHRHRVGAVEGGRRFV